MTDDLSSNKMEKPYRNAPAKFKSKVWKHFGIANGDDKKVVCKHCLAEMKYTGGTTNMSTHISRHHKLLDVETDTGPPVATTSVDKPATSKIDKPVETKLTNPFFIAGKQKLPESKTHRITMRIANHLIQDMRPFSQVESKAFREIIQECEPRYKFPSRTTFKENLIPKIYTSVSQKVKNEIANNDVAFTTDSWTSRSVKSYVTVTAHYISEEFEMCSKILQTRELEESHTGENIGFVLKQAANEWGCSVHSITTDNASNMKIAAKAAEIPVHLGCFAHTLNLASNKAVEVRSVNQLLGRIRVLVNFFHRSTTAAAVLREKQAQLQIAEHKLVIDVKTRWNSSYLMVQRFLEQQVAVLAAMTDERVKKMHSSKSKTCSELLSPDEIQKLEDFMKIMAPMYHATLAMSEDQQPTVGIILPLLNKLKTHFEETQNDSTFEKAIKTAVRENLKQRYSEEGVINFLQEAEALDPRFKHLTTDATWSRVHAKVVKVCSQGVVTVKAEPVESSNVQTSASAMPPLPNLPVLSEASSSASEVPAPHPVIKTETGCVESSPPRKKSALSYLFEDDVEIVKVEAPLPAEELATKELTMYKNEPRLKSIGNPLAYWKGMSDAMPMLSKVVRQVLCTQASSVPSERVFSTAGDIITATRSCLDSDTLDMLIFLKKNMTAQDLNDLM